MTRSALLSRLSYTAATAALLLCMQPLPVTAAPVAPPSAQGTARVWVYRTFEPSVSHGLATVAIDGTQMFLSPNGEATYIDVPAGRITGTVDYVGT